jgi:hypothetical protein
MKSKLTIVWWDVQEDENDHINETSGENRTPDIYTSVSSEYKLDAGKVQKI